MFRELCCTGLLLPVLAVSGCDGQNRTSFHRDVHPILQEKCLECHVPPDGKGYKVSGLNMESYETLMHGSLYGPVIVPGDSLHSIFMMFVEGRVDLSMHMSHHCNEELYHCDKQLNDVEIATLRSWIEQGATEE